MGTAKLSGMWSGKNRIKSAMPVGHPVADFFEAIRGKEVEMSVFIDQQGDNIHISYCVLGIGVHGAFVGKVGGRKIHARRDYLEPSYFSGLSLGVSVRRDLEYVTGNLSGEITEGKISGAQTDMFNVIDFLSGEGVGTVTVNSEFVLLRDHVEEGSNALSGVKVGDSDGIRSIVFISYSHEDRAWLERLRKMLSAFIRSGSLSVWDDSSIKPGDKWRNEIQRVLARTKVAVLLVSSNFIASDFIMQEELPLLLQAEERGEVKVIWLYLSACPYKEIGLDRLQAAHDISKALDALPEPEVNRTLAAVCEAIKEVVLTNGD